MKPETGKDDIVRIFKNAARTIPDKAAKVIVSGIKKNKKRLFVGTDAKIVDIMSRLFPVSTIKAFGFYRDILE